MATREAGSALKLGRVMFCLLLGVLWVRPPFVLAAESEARGNGDKTAQTLRQPVSAQRKAAADPIVEYGLASVREIQRHWRCPWFTRMVGRTTGVMVWINPQGQITDARIVAPSGDARLDMSALHAVREVGTLPPPPTGWKGRMRVNFCVEDSAPRPSSEGGTAENATGVPSGERSKNFLIR